MRTLVLTTTLVIAAPALAQNANPIEGPVANTIMLGSGWEMTPSDDDCMLVHRNVQNRPDLLVASGRASQEAVFGLILPPGAPYAAALQLTVVDQSTNPKQIGRVTFTPHQDRGGTFLLAKWPTANLLPRLQAASRLSFYGPGQRLVASVSTVGGAAAVSSFSLCLGARPSSGSAQSGAAPTPANAADDGWTRGFSAERCTIGKTTRGGNELDFWFDPKDGFLMMLRLSGGKPVTSNQLIPVSVTFDRRAPDRVTVLEHEDASFLIMHTSSMDGHPLMLGRKPVEILVRLAQPKWTDINLESPVPMHKSTLQIKDSVAIDGGSLAVAALNRCIGALPR